MINDPLNAACLGDVRALSLGSGQRLRCVLDTVRPSLQQWIRHQHVGVRGWLVLKVLRRIGRPWTGAATGVPLSQSPAG